ncbi:hypothetical protein [Rhodococcus chondri]|uniref:Uncharacterized protein n=1 Tax=Rhodococcus chondri TaxID=3065941 RepID=A0ABU7JTM5_9NOCA|nr:hypothetical protein [Rhodococcus sp. CC-R104]MEE2033373.1 hypothetical protein [Rhodococcus sp. CC-R104]
MQLPDKSLLLTGGSAVTLDDMITEKRTLISWDAPHCLGDERGRADWYAVAQEIGCTPEAAR